MKTEDFKDLIRPIVYKYGSGWLLDNPEMLEEICKKYHNKQLTIHSVVKSLPIEEIQDYHIKRWNNGLEKGASMDEIREDMEIAKKRLI